MLGCPKTNLAIQLLSQHGHLLDDQPRYQLGQFGNKSRDGFRPLGIVRVELLVADLSQYLLGELGIVVLFG